LKRILVYYTPNKRSVAIETLCKAIKEAGHEVFVLTLTEKGAFHEAVEKMGISTFAYEIPRKPTWKYFLQHARYLVSFCKQHNIDIVWSHLQGANVIAVLAQPFLKAEVIAFRHHAESAFYAEYGEQFNMQRNKNELRLDKLVNRLAKKIVVPSSGVWYSMEKYEGCDMSKVQLVPYIYDFSTYGKPDEAGYKKLRNDHSCQLMLIMVSRMVESKQHMPVFEVVQKLISEGLSIKMIVMDDGDLKPVLEKFIQDHKLEQDFLMVGFKTNFVDYMAASDILIHPSLTEASSNVAKEMGLLKKAIAVCEGVGDFDDYIKAGENGYILKRDNLKTSIEETIRQAYNHPEQMKTLGENLYKDVFRLFSDTDENRQRFLKLI
jgi:glycosyltransferase involved in cell wall biosynthesis